MMIMRWCNVETNGYDVKAKTYPTICTLHKLHNNNENKFPTSYDATKKKFWIYFLSRGIFKMAITVRYHEKILNSQK